MNYFFPLANIIISIKTIIPTTMKMPTPTPVLKIPPIAEQEFMKNERSAIVATVRKFIFFISILV